MDITTHDRGCDPRTSGPPMPGEVVHKTDMDESKAFPSRQAHGRPRKAALGHDGQAWAGRARQHAQNGVACGQPGRTNHFLRRRARTEATSEPKRGKIGTQDVVTWAKRTCSACSSTMSMPAQRFLGHMVRLCSLKARQHESGDGSGDPPQA